MGLRLTAFADICNAVDLLTFWTFKSYTRESKIRQSCDVRYQLPLVWRSGGLV